jgi:transposase InsO family protein
MMDEFSRCGLALELSFSFAGRSVIAILDEVAELYGYPKYLRIDNGTELTSKVMQLWSEEHCVELLFIQPGTTSERWFTSDASTQAMPRSGLDIVLLRVTRASTCNASPSTIGSLIDQRTPARARRVFSVIPIVRSRPVTTASPKTPCATRVP